MSENVCVCERILDHILLSAFAAKLVDGHDAGMKVGMEEYHKRRGDCPVHGKKASTNKDNDAEQNYAKPLVNRNKITGGD